MDRHPDVRSAEDDLQPALYAFGVLEGEELAAFERHLISCALCRAEVERERAAIAKVLVTPEMAPSPGFKERLLRRARLGLAATADPEAEVGNPQRWTNPRRNGFSNGDTSLTHRVKD
jgi:hypothetical protein